jgi:hypothetical protein
MPEGQAHRPVLALFPLSSKMPQSSDSMARGRFEPRNPLRRPKSWNFLRYFGPSGQIGRSFLVRAIAYGLQEQTFGGLKPATRRLLARIAGEAATNLPKRRKIRKAATGTILVREWQGNARSTGLRARSRRRCERSTADIWSSVASGS